MKKHPRLTYAETRRFHELAVKEALATATTADLRELERLSIKRTPPMSLRARVIAMQESRMLDALELFNVAIRDGTKWNRHGQRDNALLAEVTRQTALTRQVRAAKTGREARGIYEGGASPDLKSELVKNSHKAARAGR